MDQHSPTEIKKIALIGVGLVGIELARNLIHHDYEVFGFDLNPDRLQMLTEIGGLACDNGRDAVQNSDGVVLLSLMTSDIVESVLFNAKGFLNLSEVALPSYIIDTTTGEPEKTIDIAKRCHNLGVQYFDATISGPSDSITNRSAVFMVGGQKESFRQLTPIFSALSDKILYVGENGMGSKAKLAVNLVLGLNRAALAEGLVFAETLGMDLAVALDLFSNTFAYSKIIDLKGDRMVTSNFDPAARLSQHFKDINLILEVAHKFGQHLPLEKTHHQIMKDAIQAGDGDLDNSAIIKQIRREKF